MLDCSAAYGLESQSGEEMKARTESRPPEKSEKIQLASKWDEVAQYGIPMKRQKCVTNSSTNAVAKARLGRPEA